MDDKDYLQILGDTLRPELEETRQALNRLFAPELEEARQALTFFFTSETEKARQDFGLVIATIQENAQQQINSALEGLGPLFKEWGAIFDSASKIMRNNGWWILLELPIDFYRDLVNVGDNISREALTDLIVRWANNNRCERLAKIVDAWEIDTFESRREHLAQALWAHRRKKYCVTVPTLLVHVEGIIRDFVANPGWRFQGQLEEFKKKFPQIENREKDLKTALMNFYNIGALVTLYENHQPRPGSVPSDLNRHAYYTACGWDMQPKSTQQSYSCY